MNSEWDEKSFHVSPGKWFLQVTELTSFKPFCALSCGLSGPSYNFSPLLLLFSGVLFFPPTPATLGSGRRPFLIDRIGWWAFIVEGPKSWEWVGNERTWGLSAKTQDWLEMRGRGRGQPLHANICENQEFLTIWLFF